MVTETISVSPCPMSFLRADTLVLCLLSSDPVRRLYEYRPHPGTPSKKLDIRIAGKLEHDSLFDDVIPAVLPEAADDMRTPFEILIPQLLGYHLSRGLGLNPDNPSPNGVSLVWFKGSPIHAGHGGRREKAAEKTPVSEGQGFTAFGGFTAGAFGSGKTHVLCRALPAWKKSAPSSKATYSGLTPSYSQSFICLTEVVPDTKPKFSPQVG